MINDKTIDQIVTFDKGLYGLEHLKRYQLMDREDDPTGPFKMLHSLDESNVSFIVVSPHEIQEDYDIEIEDFELKSIGVQEESDVLVMCIVSFSKDDQALSANLKSPLILSMASKKGRQIILNDSPYPVRYALMAGS